MEGTVRKYKVIQPNDNKCICEYGVYVPVCTYWVSEDIEVTVIYCIECNSAWKEF